MNRRNWPIAAVAMMTFAGCVPAVMTPTMVATPGFGKSQADFAGDHTTCSAQANQQVAPAVQAANNQVAGTALLNVMTGTGDNTANVNAQATSTLQRQYDFDYAQCMYAKGDIVPGFGPIVAEPSEPTSTVQHVRHARKKPAEKPTSTASAAPASAPAAQPANFVEPAPAQPASASGGFAVPPPAAR